MPDVKKDLGECEARHVVLPYFLPLTFIQYACATVSESVGKKRDQCDRFAKRIYIKWKNFRILQRRYEILRLPYHATASNLFGQCTQENSRVEENICSEKRPIKLLFSSSQAKGPLLVLLLAQDFCVLLLRSHYFCKITLARGEKISVILMHYKKLLQYSRFFQRKKIM